MGEFVGGRIVPKHCGTWNKKSKYEMLSIVYQPETGDSYISRRSVPAGTALSSEEYWAICSEYSAQVHQLELDVDADVQQMHTDLTQTKADMSREFSETHTAISKELTDTHTAISQELSTTEQRIAQNLQETTTTLTGQVTTARNDLAAGRKDLETTKNQLTERMNSIVGGNTTDTEILDARVDADGKTYANLSERLKAVDAYYAGADAETVDGTAHGSLAKYIHEEWRNDYDLIRGETFYKGHVDVSGLNASDDMSGCVDPNGEGYYLLIPTGNLHDAKLNVLFYGLRGKPAFMRGNWGGMEGDFHYAGRLSIVPAQHFKEMDDSAIMMLTSISAWNRSSAKYLYINLTEEEAAKAQVVVCDTEGTPCMNCLTELLNRVGADRDRRAVQREATILSKIEQDKQTELEPIRTAVAENKTAIDNQNKAVEEKLAKWNESVKESIEQALQVQNSNWRGKTINFIGDSITYGAYTPVGGSSPNKRAEKRYCEIACEKLGATCRNYGVSGISISSTSYQSPTGAISLRYSSMDAAADMVVIAGGTNDYGTGVALGTIADTTDVSFYGALHVLCSGLCEKYPGKRIVFLTPFHRSSEAANKVGATLAQYKQAIYDVARDEFGFVVLDGWTVGLSPKNAKVKAEYIVDGVHPNPIGHELIGASLARMLNAI